MPTRFLPRIVARASVLVLAGSLALAASATSTEQLLFLLEYVAVDYEAAVRDGEIADPNEFREMVEFSERLVHGFEQLRLHGASEQLRDGLVDLRKRIAERRPVDEVRSLASALAARLFDELDSVAVPAEPPSAERGARLFVPNCAPCHGMAGGGDGWAAGWLDPKPTSFREPRMKLLSPHLVYSAVAFGIDGTAMPSYSGALSSQEMWDLAFHVLTLRPGANRSDIDFYRGSPPGADPGLELAIRLQDAFAAVAERVFPSVVGVTVMEQVAAKTRKRKSGGWTAGTIEERLYPGYRRVRSGSGFVVAEDGYILTSARLLSDSGGNAVDFVDVEFHDDRHHLATVVGLEPTVDLAVLRLVTHESVPPPRVLPATLGDSDRVLVGHWTIGVGNPWGPGTSYAVGTLSSAPDRQCYQEQLTATMMRSTLRLPEESFGGPLVDIRGHVVGLTTPGFDGLPGSSVETSAIPINLVRGIYESLRVVASRESPWLGFSVLDLAAARRRPAGGSAVLARTGVYIDDLFEPSPAATADIRIGDCLVAIDGERLFSPLDFQKWLYLNGIGATMTLEIYRDGTTLEKEVTIERRPPEATTR